MVDAEVICGESGTAGQATLLDRPFAFHARRSAHFVGIKGDSSADHIPSKAIGRLPETLLRNWFWPDTCFDDVTNPVLVLKPLA